MLENTNTCMVVVFSPGGNKEPASVKTATQEQDPFKNTDIFRFFLAYVRILLMQYSFATKTHFCASRSCQKILADRALASQFDACMYTSTQILLLPLLVLAVGWILVIVGFSGIHQSLVVDADTLREYVFQAIFSPLTACTYTVAYMAESMQSIIAKGLHKAPIS